MPIRSYAAARAETAVGLQVGQGDVREPVVADPVPEVHGAPHRLPPPIQLLRPQLQ